MISHHSNHSELPTYDRYVWHKSDNCNILTFYPALSITLQYLEQSLSSYWVQSELLVFSTNPSFDDKPVPSKRLRRLQ